MDFSNFLNAVDGDDVATCCDRTAMGVLPFFGACIPGFYVPLLVQ